jgi:hypothetical protein
VGKTHLPRQHSQYTNIYSRIGCMCVLYFSFDYSVPTLFKCSAVTPSLAPQACYSVSNMNALTCDLTLLVLLLRLKSFSHLLVWKQELKCIKKVLKSQFLSLSLLSPLPWWAWLGAIGSIHVVINEKRERVDFSPF